MLRLATFWTPSHRDMAREFVLDRVRGFTDIVAVEYPQQCPSGSFKSPGWNTIVDTYKPKDDNNGLGDLPF